MSKKEYVNYKLGTMKLAPKDGDGPDRYYLQFEQAKDKEGNPYGDQIFPITLANGVVINDGDCAAMFSKKEEFRRRVANGQMTEAQAEKLSFLKFDVSLGVPKSEVPKAKSASKSKVKVQDDDDDIDF